MPALSRVQQHYKMLGVLWIAYGVCHAIGGGVLLIVAYTIFNPYADTGHPAFLHPLLTGIGICVLVLALLSAIAGIGLLERQSWARPLSLVLGIVALINIPLGTALGIFTLWVFMSPEGDVEYERLSASA
jgi:hypothetical protein